MFEVCENTETLLFFLSLTVKDDDVEILKMIIYKTTLHRFNGLDSRLERTMQAACMVMEAFEGYKEKFKVSNGF